MYERIVVALTARRREQILPTCALAHQFGARLTLVQATIAVEQVASSMEPTMGGAVRSRVDRRSARIGRGRRHELPRSTGRNLRARRPRCRRRHPPGSADDVIFETAQRLKAT